MKYLILAILITMTTGCAREQFSDAWCMDTANMERSFLYWGIHCKRFSNKKVKYIRVQSGGRTTNYRITY